MNHDDGNLINEVHKSDIILIGVSRTSKTPTSIYLANKGFKTSNIPLVNENSLPETLKKSQMACSRIGTNQKDWPIKKEGMNSLRETENTQYTDLENIKKEVLDAKKHFKNINGLLLMQRKSVEETAASIIKIHEIYSNNAR